MLADIFELRERRICNACVSEQYLTTEIQRSGTRKRCHYCRRVRRTFDLGEIAQRLERAFEEHYERTSPEPDAFQWAMIKDRESSYNWSREGMATAELIGEALGLDGEEAADDLQQILVDEHAPAPGDDVGEEYEFGNEVHYQRRPPSSREWWQRWRWAEQSLLADTRLFNRSLRDLLEQLFIELREADSSTAKLLVTKAGPGEVIDGFWRARFTQSKQKLHDVLKQPEAELGPPPHDLATPGRMNVQGISVFYGADLPEVALAEIRPPVGSDAVIGRFDLVRPIRLLNLAAFQNLEVTGSVFDPTYLERATRAVFLGQLGDMLSAPVLPDDKLRGYLMTQAICDFLADAQVYDIDGILFQSSQSAIVGTNVVLFHKAARLEPVAPPGTDLSCDLAGGYAEDEPPTHYAVRETRRLITKNQEEDFFLPSVGDDEPPSNDFARAATLRLDRTTVVVRQVGGVRIDITSSLPVTWSTRTPPTDF